MLGLILEQKLNFHLDKANKKNAGRKSGQPKDYYPHPWVVSEKTLLQFYKSHLRAHTDYVLIVYGACAKTTDSKIKSTQRLG